MFSFFKKKSPWISEEAVKIIADIPKQYVVYVNYKTHSELVKNECGDMIVDLAECKDVKGITVKYQEDGVEMLFPVYSKLNTQYMVDLFAKWINGIVASNRPTKSDVSMNDLYSMQRKLRDAIQNTILVTGYQPEESKDINIYPNSLPEDGRQRLAKLIMSLDKNSVDVLVTIRLSGSTMEQIDSTLNELAMYEALG